MSDTLHYVAAPAGRETPRALLTGNEDSDLARLRGLPPLRLAMAVRGVPSAIAKMRTHEFAVVVADAGSSHDVLVLARAARRSRPPTRLVLLLPPNVEASAVAEAAGEVSPAAVLVQPLAPGALDAALAAAADDYEAERAGRVVSLRPGRSERVLADLLRRLVDRVVAADSESERDARVAEAASALVRAAKRAGAGPAVSAEMARSIESLTAGGETVRLARQRSDAA